MPARLVLMAPLPATVRYALRASLDEAGVLAMLGDALSPARLWHQSLSPDFVDTPDMRRRLLAAGSRFDAAAVAITYDQVRYARHEAGELRCSVAPTGAQTAFDALQDTLLAALIAEDIVAEHRRTAHVTLSYHAPSQAPTRRIRPVTWWLDTIELVAPGGTPYRYDTLARWTLSMPAGGAAEQPSLLP